MMQSKTTKLARRPKTLDADLYEHDPKMSMAQRMANYLDWAATNWPGEYTPYNRMLKAINGYARMPHMDSKEVETMRASITRARSILIEKYGRELVTSPGTGARATVDDTDAAKNALAKKARHLSGAVASFKKTAAIIDASQVTDPTVKKWLQTDVKAVLRLTQGDEFQKHLALPAPAVVAPESKQEKAA